MAIWNTFRKNSFKFGYEGHLVLTVYLKKYLMGKWLRGPDLNRRPSGYEPDELPGCSTPRLKRGKFYAFWTEFANNAGIWYRRRDVKSAFSILIVDPTCQPNFRQID